MTPAPSGAAAALLRSACVLGLIAAALTVGDAMATVLRGSTGRDALERAYVARTGSSAEQATAVIGSALGGTFVVGLLLAAAIAALALLAPRASRGVRTGLVICTLLALPGAFGGALALGRAVTLVAALACVLSRPATAAFAARRAAVAASAGNGDARSPGAS